MNSLRGRRDPRTGRVFGFQSETQRENFMIGRARFCNGPNREMPRCYGSQSLGRALQGSQDARQVDLLPPQRKAAVKRARLAAAHLSGDLDRIQRAEMRSERNRLRALWRRDPREPGRTIMLDPADEATCRAWAARQGFQLDLLDRDLPAFADAVPMDMGRMSRGLISNDELTAKIARLRDGGEQCIRSFVMTVADSFLSSGRSAGSASSVDRSRERSDRIATRAEGAEEEAGDDAVAPGAGSPGHCRAGGDRHPVGGRRTLARRGPSCARLS